MLEFRAFNEAVQLIFVRVEIVKKSLELVSLPVNIFSSFEFLRRRTGFQQLQSLVNNFRV